MRRTSLLAAAAPLLIAGVVASGATSSAKSLSAHRSESAHASSACAKGNLKVHTKGFLTVATDDPAYPPYFENNKPANGKGLESAVAYAVAKQLGFTAKEVKWVVEPFDSSYAPGPKSFDFDINEISISAAREQAVDFSTPYYSDPQGIIVEKNGKYAHVTKLSQLKGAKIGVQIGTTSLAAVTSSINPTNQPDVFNSSNDVLAALKIHRVDAIVTDLATTEYMVEDQLKGAKVVGKFSAPSGNNWGLLLAKHSPLTPCVDGALAKLSKNGTLAAIGKRWFPEAAAVPTLK
jgi:polar amino acid transport system substrate-binding protein